MYRLECSNQTDFPLLLEIWELSVRATHHFLKPDDIDFFKQIIQEKEVFAHVDITVVKDDAGAILGFLGVAADSIEMLFLHPNAMGLGLGKLLLKHAVDNLGKRKVDVNEDNIQAKNFYEHFGFQIISRSELDGTGKPYPILHLQLPA